MQRMDELLPPLLAVLTDAVTACSEVVADARQSADRGQTMAALGTLQSLERLLPDTMTLVAAALAAGRSVGTSGTSAS